jgi:hypothetical protein
MGNTIPPLTRGHFCPETANESRYDAYARRRGGQPGNKTALRHGRCSAAAVMSRKESVARLKALAHVIRANEMWNDPSRHRISPLRRALMRRVIRVELIVDS